MFILHKLKKWIGYNIPSMRRIFLQFFLVFTLLFSALAVPVQAVHADDGVTTASMISWANGLRTGTYNLPALVENSTLDSMAQWTAQEMATISAQNHLAYLGYPDAATRAQYAGFGGGATVYVTEDYASDSAMTLDKLASAWSDTVDMYPMDKPEYVYIGAGVATVNGKTYYVIQAAYIQGQSAATTPGVGTAAVTSEAATPTSNQIITSTPNYDGNIYHTVEYGQTLFDIALAYGITLDYLKSENGLTSDSVTAGQTLLIKPVSTSTITPTFTLTPVYPTRTPTFTPQPRTSTVEPTATATPVPTVEETLPKLDRPSLGIILVALSILGLAALVFFNFIKPAKVETPVVPPAPMPTKPAASVAQPEEKKSVKPTKKKSVATVAPETKLPEAETKKRTPRKKKTEE